MSVRPPHKDRLLFQTQVPTLRPTTRPRTLRKLYETSGNRIRPKSTQAAPIPISPFITALGSVGPYGHSLSRPTKTGPCRRFTPSPSRPYRPTPLWPCAKATCHYPAFNIMLPSTYLRNTWTWFPKLVSILIRPEVRLLRGRINKVGTA